VRLLLKHGASCRRVVKEGPYPLHAAAAGGHLKIVNVLLEAGANPETKDPQTKETAMLMAAGRGQMEVVRRLLDRGTRINERDAVGKTALYTAVEDGYEDLARLLLARKADPNVASDAGATPLHVAAWFGRTELARLLLDHEAARETQTKSGLGGTALHLAAQREHIDTVRLLLDRKADMHARNGLGQNVLNTAINFGKREVTRRLLDWGASIESSDDSGFTPLQTAISAWEGNGGKVMAKLLLDRKANIRGVSKDGQTALHVAAQTQNRAAIAFMLDRKADINVRETKEGRTPLHFAIEDGAGLDEPSESRALPAVRLLLERKADVTIKDARGRTPLALAIEMNYMKVAEMLRKHGAKK
jgi:ankyrin